ncbi:MAG: hypothetical protein LBH47_02720, partial [Christensenellaceae bacterium]|nr:hypothetical protein [Christensenellaceae bacterium]
MQAVYRVVVQRKEGANAEATSLKEELINNLKIKELTELDIANIYDIEGMTEEQVKNFTSVLAEPMVDKVTVGEFNKRADKQYI